MLWTKQYYNYDVTDWLRGDPAGPPPARSEQSRNEQWFHMLAADVISMPDKWEYPWFAAWDLAFHAVVFTLVDIDFAKEQLDLLTRGLYMHPNGQLPAYEWNFGDVNPPVQAWATWRVYTLGASTARPGRPRISGTVLRPAADELHVVDQPQGCLREATSLKGASWVWTTSAFSIAARRFPAACASNRPTAPPGWPCTAWTCCRWPWNWLWMTIATRNWPPSSTSTSSTSRRPTPSACGMMRMGSTTINCGWTTGGRSA